MQARMTRFVTRFAPSPSGLLHLGHAFSALTAWDAAQEADGRFLLRIEDIDAGRCRPEFETAIFEDLAWLGLAWDEPVRRQSEHMADYTRLLDDLIARGLVYRDFRTRKELLADIANAPHDTAAIVRDGPAEDEAERLDKGEAFAWRLSLDRARDHLGARFDDLRFACDGLWLRAEPERLGDVVLARKDFATSYHLASVHDDALQNVTHIIRGEDLREVADVHVLLQALLDLPTPIYRHHRLITDAAGKRLAKRDLAATLRSLRESGATPHSVRKQLGLRE